ncbi:glycosyl transferase family 2 [Solidesulfovibrio carbinoliphilus subsp. oakridgensis]|uniref:Glycosyl transferase family 2 n=1 Tax=Solidesulfovibrio carbinoliphilus subsp. oakridgensis TaxID=694327 RepID=G7Q4J4_9BACT|nr:glycosyltransferase [Solidesulfovibrio carbinoliphilus]EHJ47217.1 glycosyl transferase family 2 [Solidesulfovibrio carbinoliphilus subsp. oakridgensis]
MYGACWVLSFAALAVLVRWWPGGWGRGRSTAGILAAGLVLRLLFVWAWPADSDVNRYIVEGVLQAAGGNPYLTAPGEPGLAERLPEAARPALPGVNHKELAAAYPPLAELYCRLVAALSPTPLGFKAAAGLADLAGCAVMALVLARRGLPASLLLLWAANPLALGMAAGEGHLDALVGLGVALGLLAFARGRHGLGSLCLGAAGMVKYPALVLIPFFLDGKNVGKLWPAFVPLALFGLYAEAGGQLFSSLAAFAGYLSHGGPVVALLQPLCGRGAPAVSLVVGGVVLAGVWLTVQDQRRGPLAAMAVVLACLPSAYPWYFLALVPLWLVRPDRSVWWLLAGQGLVTAPAWLRPAGLGGEGLALAAAWMPWAGLVVWGWYRPWVSGPGAGPLFGPVAGLSVVVPARNEAARLGACLASLAGAVAAGEIVSVVVADGGSADATVAVARAGGAKVVAAAGGRGGQIAAGVAACGGDAVLVLHADAVCREDVPGRIVRAFNAHPALAGGAVGMAFAGKGPGLAALVALNAWRARMTGISFGDQGQFFRRQALDGRGGFPDMALMEDVELALRLREAGETVLLGGGLAVSGRRWEGPGFGAKVVRVLRLFAGYLMARRLGWADPTGRAYYRRYYGRPPHQTGV